MDLRVPYATISPTLVSGGGGLLLNNIAQALRRFPFSPVYAEDLAAQAVESGSQHGISVSDARGAGHAFL